MICAATPRVVAPCRAAQACRAAQRPLHRALSSTHTALNAEHQVSRKEIRKRLAEQAKQWLEAADGGQKFKYSPRRGNVKLKWVGKVTPFPLNPDFKPQAPLNDRVREELYQAYMADPTTNSPRALAQKHQLEVVRVEAVLRLKALEKRMEAGDSHYPAQGALSRGMEELFDVAQFRSVADYVRAGRREPEPARLVDSIRLKPLFQIVDEDEMLSPEDAARLLRMDPFAKLSARLDRSAARLNVADLESGGALAGSEDSADATAVDPTLSGEPLLVRDISPHRPSHQPEYLVRERSGRLRPLSKVELLRQKQAQRRGERLYQPHVATELLSRAPGPLAAHPRPEGSSE